MKKAKKYVMSYSCYDKNVTLIETTLRKQYNKLYEELVPRQGPADTVEGELIRAIGRLLYEYYNNGNTNAVLYDHDNETPTEITPLYNYFLTLIEIYIPELYRELSALRRFIMFSVNNPDHPLDQKYHEKYNQVADHVVIHVLNRIAKKGGNGLGTIIDIDDPSLDPGGSTIIDKILDGDL